MGTLFTILISIIKDKLRLEESLADTDVLTGLANRRFFMERVDIERYRSSRYKEVFTIAYIDLDNFKHINDAQGHEVGDEVLMHVSQSLLTNIRNVDLAARLGGDEFAIIFPLMDIDEAKVALQNMRSHLTQSVNEKNWPISLSIGAVTFTQPMNTSREMIKLVDDLMYQVKRTGKDNVAFKTWPSSSDES